MRASDVWVVPRLLSHRCWIFWAVTAIAWSQPTPFLPAPSLAAALHVLFLPLRAAQQRREACLRGWSYLRCSGWQVAATANWAVQMVRGAALYGCLCRECFRHRTKCWPWDQVPLEPHHHLSVFSSPTILPSTVQQGISSMGSLPGFSGTMFVWISLAESELFLFLVFFGMFGGRRAGWSPASPPVGRRAMRDGCGQPGATGSWWCLHTGPSRAPLDIVLLDLGQEPTSQDNSAAHLAPGPVSGQGCCTMLCFHLASLLQDIHPQKSRAVLRNEHAAGEMLVSCSDLNMMGSHYTPDVWVYKQCTNCAGIAKNIFQVMPRLGLFHSFSSPPLDQNCIKLLLWCQIVNNISLTWNLKPVFPCSRGRVSLALCYHAASNQNFNLISYGWSNPYQLY